MQLKILQKRPLNLNEIAQVHWCCNEAAFDAEIVRELQNLRYLLFTHYNMA